MEDTVDNNIKIGDYIVAGGVNYLVYEEYNHPQKEHYLKHRVIECNVEIKVDNVAQYAMYVSSLRKFTDTMNVTSGDLTMLRSGEKPVVITAQNNDLKQGMRIMLGSQDVFEIVNMDNLTNAGISYLSVKESSINEYTDDLVDNAAKTAPEPTITPAPPQSIEAGISTTINTNFAYAVFSTPVEIVSKTLTTVEFICPYGIGSLTITTKDGAGDTVETVYEVV